MEIYDRSCPKETRHIKILKNKYAISGEKKTILIHQWGNYI